MICSNISKRQIDNYISEVLRRYLHLPNNTNYHIEKVIIGNYNINCVVHLAGKKYVLRINIEKQSGIPNQIEYEYKALKYLEQYNIAPKPYLFDSSKNILPYDILVEEYIPGNHLDYDDSKKIIGAAVLLSTLHGIPKPQDELLMVWSNPLKDSLKEIIRMFKSYKQRKSSDEKFIEYGVRLIGKLEKNINLHSKYFSNKNIVHTDVVNDNFIYSPKGITLIDWEKPRVDDSSYDLCVFLGKPSQIWGSSRFMNEKEKHLFLSEYCRKGGVEFCNLKEKVRIRQPYVSFRWILWGAHRTADADEGVILPELKRFHSKNYLRYKKTAATENIEELLKSL